MWRKPHNRYTRILKKHPDSKRHAHICRPYTMSTWEPPRLLVKNEAWFWMIWMWNCVYWDIQQWFRLYFTAQKHRNLTKKKCIMGIQRYLFVRWLMELENFFRFAQRKWVKGLLLLYLCMCDKTTNNASHKLYLLASLKQIIYSF